MRAFVVAVAATALAISSAASANNGNWNWKSAKTARALETNDCLTAIANAAACQQTVHSNNGNHGDAIRASGCCTYVDGLSACGADFFAEVAAILGSGTTTNLDQIVGAMDLVGNCPRAGTSSESCNATIAASTACVGAGSPNECCSAFTAQINQCVGQPEMYDGNNNHFWDNYQNLVMQTNCPAFSDALCTNAANLLTTCVNAIADPAAVNITGYSSCCVEANWLDMFCINEPTTLYESLIPNADAMANLNQTCNDRNHNGGGGNGGPVCDWSRQAYGFQWYNWPTGGSTVVTSNSYYSPEGSSPAFCNYGTCYFPVDYSRFPNLSKLQPIDINCYSYSGSTAP